MKNRHPPWADLPQEILSAIAETLTLNPIWVFTFRSVCKSWRSSCHPFSGPSLLAPASTLPLSMPCPPYSGWPPEEDGVGPSYLTATIIYALRRPINVSEVGLSLLGPETWVLFLDEFSPGFLRVRKPFTRCTYSRPINFPKSFKLIDCNVVELGRFYSISFAYEFHVLDKVVLLSNGVGVLALFDGGKLGVWRFDIIFGEWEIIHDAKGFRFDDIVEFKGRVLGVDRRGRVYDIGYRSNDMNVIVHPIARGGGRRKRLVESSGLLYLVVRSNVGKGTGAKVGEFNAERRKTKFQVYELNENRKKWVEVSNLGDRSFFFGHDFSFSASAHELGISEKNCILFKIESFESYRGDCDKIDDYKMLTELKKSDLFIGVWDLNDTVHVGSIESYLGYLNMLWPPPPWFWRVDRLNRLEKLEIALGRILGRIPDRFKKMATEDSCDDFFRQASVDAVKEVFEFKETVTLLQEGERDFLLAYKLSMETLSIHQLDSLLRTARHDTEEGLGSEEIQSGTEQSETGNALGLRVLLESALGRHRLIFHIEGWVKEMQMSPKAGLARVLTK